MDYVIYLALSALILPFHGIYATVQIQNCESNWVDIKEQEQSKIHCTNLNATDTVVWYIDADPYEGHFTWLELGRCPPFALDSSCNTNRGDTTFSRTETTSTMVIQSNHRYFSKKPLKCSNEDGSAAFICQARVLHYGQPSRCKIFVHSDNKTVSGSCYTEKWFTSDNDYSCQWGYAAQAVIGSSNIQLETVLITSPKNETNIFYQATCAFSTSMNNGAYNFFITFTPGPKYTLVGSVQIPPKDFIAGEQQSILQTLAIIPGSTPRLVMTCAGFQHGLSTHLFKWTGVTCDNSATTQSCAFTPDADTDSGRQATCSVTFGKSGKVVNASFRLSFSIPDTEKPSIVDLSLNQAHQSLTIGGTEQATVILRCRATGFPKPSIRVVRVDTGQPLEVDTSHTSGQDENVQQYTLTSSARCQDAAIYSCQANNTVGITHGNVTLLVNCAPTLTEELQHLTDGSTVLFITSEKAIDVIGYPPPVPHVTFFGDTNPFTKEAGLGKETGDLFVLCKPSGYIYMTNCTISDGKSTTANSGFYAVTFVNTFGEVSVAVYLDASSQKEDSLTGSDETQTFPVAAVAGGVAASVLAIIVIICIVFFIRRRYFRTYERPNRRRDQDANPYTGLRPTGAAANGNSRDVNAQGVYEEINPEQRHRPTTETHLHKSSGEGTALHDYTNTTSVPHVYQNTLQSSDFPDA